MSLKELGWILVGLADGASLSSADSDLCPLEEKRRMLPFAYDSNFTGRIAHTELKEEAGIILWRML